MILRLRRARFMLRHPRFLWWAITNRAEGLKFDYIGRFRCCDHTTPFHYPTCPNREAPRG